MELIVVVIYAALLALVAPFVLPKSDFYGKFVPFSIALGFGSIIWIALTWIGFSYVDAWIWLIVMLTMPLAAWLGTSYLHKTRMAQEQQNLEQLRLRGKA